MSLGADPVEFQRRGGRRVLLAVTSAAFVAGPTAVSAVECGAVLTADTVLEADLTCPGDGLVVGADGILIDLGGHLLRGLGLPGSAGIRNDGRRDVEIRNGSIKGFDRGIDLFGVTGNRIEALSIEGGFGGDGIALAESQQNHLRGNEVRHHSEHGIVLIDSHRNRIEGNRSTLASGGDGIALLRSDHNEVIDNFVRNNDLNGILLEHADHNLVEGNTSDSNFQDAISLFDSHDNRLIANSAGNSDGSSIQLWSSHRNLVAGNELPRGEGDGFLVSSSHYNRIESNFIGSHPGGDAMRLSASDYNLVTGNTAVGNRREPRPPCCPAQPSLGIRVAAGTGNRLTGNAVTEHGLDGILVEATSRETQLRRNLAADNGDDGLDVEDSTAQIVGNTALGNSDFGIEAVPGVRGGGNRALGNGDPEQCLEIACK